MQGSGLRTYRVLAMSVRAMGTKGRRATVGAYARREETTGRSVEETAHLGQLPEWDLTDLYDSMETPAFAADMERALAECRSFAETYQGRLTSLIEEPLGGQ